MAHPSASEELEELPDQPDQKGDDDGVLGGSDHLRPIVRSVDPKLRNHRFRSHDHGDYKRQCQSDVHYEGTNGQVDLSSDEDSEICQTERRVTPEWGGLVAHTGFEPVISALRGRCPWPLDECATQGANQGINWLGIEDSNLGLQIQSLLSYH